MDQTTKEKLKNVIEKNAQMQREVAAAQKQRGIEERARAEKREAARERWKVTFDELKSAVAEINEEIKNAGMSLKIFEGRAAPPAISQIFVQLLPKQEAERQIVFNVNAYGAVVPIVLIPHTGRPSSSFNIDEASQESLTAILVDFLDQVLAYETKKSKTGRN